MSDTRIYSAEDFQKLLPVECSHALPELTKLKLKDK